MISVAILIPIYNRLEITKKGLSSLNESLAYYSVFGQGTIKYTMIVIDDGSNDGSPEWISSNYRDVILLRGDGNLWWTGAINKGADYAIDELKSDYLLLWNDDVHPCRNYFVTLENLICEGCYVNAVIGSKIVMMNPPDRIWSAGGFFNRFSGNFGMKSYIYEHDKKIVICDWQPGMGTLIPVNKITALGLRWDEKLFPHYHGDSDFTLRCSSKGMQIITCLDLVIFNNTDSTGISTARSFTELRKSLTSIKSIYNVKVDYHFYSRHGYFPFVLFGMFIKYSLYIGGFFKRSLLKFI